MKTLPRDLIAVACSLFVLARAQAIAPWPMASGNFFEGFGSIATWTNDFASPAEATRWGSVTVNATGAIPDGQRTTVATSAFTTTTTGGVQRGANNLVQLSTGSTDNTSANAVDLYLDFTARAPGTLSFDWTAVTNDTGNRASSLRVYTTTNGVNFLELTNARVSNLSNNVMAAGSVVNVQLPVGFSNCATARIRFYEYNGTGGSTGKRAKIAIDNVSVTRSVLPSAITLPATGGSNSVAVLNGTANPGASATTAWFEWGLSPFSKTNLTTPVAVGSGTDNVAMSKVLSDLTPGLIYHGRLVASNAMAVVRGIDVNFGMPLLTLNGAATITNECPDFANPVFITGAPLAIAGGRVHSLALKSDGTVARWGDTHYSLTNIPVGLNGVVAIAGGSYFTMALKRDGTVSAWGDNVYDQTTVPVGLSNVVAISGGEYHSLALKNDGTVVAWGQNFYGQTTVPAGLSNVVAIAAGAYHSLALKTDGTVTAWGEAGYGQTTVPVGLSNVVAVAGGFDYSMALRRDGTVAAWGDNSVGQINVPIGLSNVVAIAGGGSHSLALRWDGTIVAWGSDFFGQTNVPVDCSNVVAIAAGSGAAHSLALKSDGTVTSWGLNDHGQTSIPADLRTLSTLVVTVGGTFNTSNALGTYTRTYTSSNSLGGIGTATRTVIVQDSQPIITLRGSNPFTNECHAAYTDPGATANAICAGARPVTTSYLINTNSPGTYTVTYKADNGSGQTNTSMRIVVVQDTMPPVITLLGTNPLITPPNMPFIDLGATALDACGGNYAVSTNNMVNVAVDGKYSVSYRATDSSGNSATNTRTVIVGILPTVTTFPVTNASNSVAALNGTVNPGSSPVTVWFEWGLNGVNNTNLTAPVVLSGGTNVMAMSELLTGLSPGFVYRGRLAASNLLAFVHGAEVLFGTPVLTLNGAETITNECHADFADSVTAAGTLVPIAGGGYHSLALKNDGTVVAWGAGFLNDGSSAVNYGQSLIPQGLSNVVAVAAGETFSIALKSEGTVAGWGHNDLGQTTGLSGLSNVTAISCGVLHSVVLRNNGTVSAWGYNGSGQTVVPAGLSNVVAIAAGGYHSLALKSDGTIAAWGYNGFGQTTVPLALSNVIAIAGGRYHSLALKGDGTVVAWGRNDFGQTNVPVGLNNVLAIAGGSSHNLALKIDGTIVAWGRNDYGQANVPVGFSNVAAIAGGGTHSLALKSDGTVVAWGYNGYGQTNVPGGLRSLPLNLTVSGTFDTNSLPGTYTRTYSISNLLGGIATATRRIVVQDTLPPVLTLLGANPLTNRIDVPFVDPGAIALDACGGNYVVTTNSTVSGAAVGTYSVSYSATDSSGNSATNSRTVIISPVPPIVTTLATTGVSNSVATLNGTIIPGTLAVTVWCEWGLDGGNSINLTPPVTMGGGLDVVTMSNLLSDLTPGLIYRGRLVTSNAQMIVRGPDVLFGSPLLTLYGAATMTNECHAAFADPGAATGAPIAIAGGESHSLALKSDGTIVAWGQNFYGQTTIPAGLSNVVAIAGGGNHSLALKNDGTVVAWGQNVWDQTTIPVGLSNVVGVAGGGIHSLALKNDGTVAGWGNNTYGQTNIPVSLSNVVAISAKAYHNLALKRDGTVAGWGLNNVGQTTIPAGLSNVVGIAAGGYHSLALKSNGTVVAWGQNTYGQITIPAGLSNVVAIAAGTSNSLALKRDGTLVAWGQNLYGQSTIPADLSNTIAIAGGGNHSLALKNEGTVVVWGNNSFGQATVPASISTFAAIVNLGGTFHTNNSPGTYTRNYSASNLLGGIAKPVTRTIVVQDTLPPVITLVGSNLLTILTNTLFVDFGATALDACDGGLSVMTNNSVNVAVPGIYTVSYIAADNNGHSATNTRVVNVVVAPPMVINPTRLGNGAFQFGFSNQPGVGFTVWASTNLALPFAKWSNLGTVVESPAGTFRFIDPQSTNQAQRFYRVSSP